MGKGKNGCQAGLDSVDSEVELLALRQRFKPYFKAELERLQSESTLINVEAGNKLLKDTLESYLSGDGGEQKWMHDFFADYRLALAELLIEDDYPPGAIALLADDSVPSERAIAALTDFRDRVASPDDRSRCRHALAAALYRVHRLDEARSELEADSGDAQVSEERRVLAAQKLDALKDAELPRDWQWRLVPPDVREQLPRTGINFASLMNHGVEGNDGHVAVKTILPRLSDAGYHWEAIELAAMTVESWHGDGGRGWHADRFYAEALRAAGRYDQAIEAYKGSAQFQGGGTTSDQDLQQVEKLYDEIGMHDHALEAARRRAEAATAAQVNDAMRDYAARLCREGKVERAFNAASVSSDQLVGTDPVSLMRSAVTRALQDCPDRALRSQMRNRLAGEFFSADQPGEALEVLESELSEPGLSDRARELTLDKIKEVKSYMNMRAA